jgi:uncharacterized membrane protein
MQSRTAQNPYLLFAATAAAALSVLALTSRQQTQPARRPPDSAPGRAARRNRFGDYVVSGRSVTINAPRERLYAMWRDMTQLPTFMENVRAVRPAADGAWSWTIAAPGGREVNVETRLVEERENEALAWRSTEGSEIDTEGKIMFRDAPGGRGTVVEAIVAYRPPGGTIGHWIAKVFRSDPKAQGRHELKRLKMLVETGEIATAANRKEA